MTRLVSFPRRFLSFVLACLTAATPAFGQTAPPQDQSAATFQAESNLVLVPVVVADRSGKHISGLQQSDFVVQDQGKEQKIVSFEEVKQAPGQMTKPQRPGEYTNAVDAGSARGMTIIVLDQVNTPFLDQAYARAQLLKFLAQHINANEPTALITVGRKGVRVIHDFTTETAVLLAALKRVSARTDNLTASHATADTTVATIGVGANAQSVMVETSALDAFYRGTDGSYGAFQLTQAIELTLSALMHLAIGMEGIPGRKSVIWATGGFPFTLTASGELASLRYNTAGATRSQLGGATAGGVLGSSGNLPPLPESTAASNDDIFANLRPQIQRTMQALNKAQIAIYPIDARGLVAYSSAASSRVRINDVYGTEAQTHITMNEIASVTGGTAYYNTNDITGAFDRATNESSQYYLLGYYAEKEKKPGWHKLKVNVSRPGVEVRARTGYMSGVAVNAKKPDELRNLDIRGAIASPLEYTGLPMRVYVDPAVAGAGNKKKVPFEIVAQPGASAIDTSNKNHLQLDFLAIARDPQGEAAGQVAQKIETNLADNQLKQVAAEGVNYKGVLQLPPGSYQLRFIVRDNLTGRIGSVVAPVQVQ
ncbi:MAG: VWA domain-containing protein [Candidatus Koribacter versatilis]|uniref:VWA domain-containing protein n=1 Tax=Candidatus Korobacter versatilis TaxID=658062 RepID=A0A932A906_9BACT|nr:VWA domain-containing protein [Candidatus Koribacter versatilis]